MKTITPEDVVKTRLEDIPEQVIEVFNTLIAKNYRSGKSVVLQDDAINLLVYKGFARRDLFDKHWLDVEPLYAKDWDVRYDKPGFNEDYPASFTFKAKRQKT